MLVPKALGANAIGRMNAKPDLVHRLVGELAAVGGHVRAVGLQPFAPQVEVVDGQPRHLGGQAKSLFGPLGPVEGSDHVGDIVGQDQQAADGARRIAPGCRLGLRPKGIAAPRKELKPVVPDHLPRQSPRELGPKAGLAVRKQLIDAPALDLDAVHAHVAAPARADPQDAQVPVGHHQGHRRGLDDGGHLFSQHPGLGRRASSVGHGAAALALFRRQYGQILEAFGEEGVVGPRPVVDDRQGADAAAVGQTDRRASVETALRRSGHVWIVSEAGVLA